MADIRADTFEFLTKQNVEFTPSESNCFMMNVKRSGKDFYAAMAKQNVYIVVVWSVWPENFRFSVGSKQEMAKFKEVFSKVYNT